MLEIFTATIEYRRITNIGHYCSQKRQKDRDARWTVKFSKARPREDGAPQVDLAVPAFGYKNHIGIDRTHGLIRTWDASAA